MKKKRKAPKKPCPSCELLVHARASKCECGYQFYEKKSSKQERWAKDWKNLSSGDVIKCVAGHGSYWLNKKTGEKVRSGVSHHGTFEVIGIYGEYIQAKQILRGRIKSTSVEYIYMGKPHLCETTGVIHKESHKIIVMKKNES